MRSRRHRSTNTPANGPSTEYGTTSTAVALAKPTAVFCLSGPNTTEATMTAWNSPSASWLTRRVANSHRKSRDSRTSRARASVDPGFTVPPARSGPAPPGSYAGWTSKIAVQSAALEAPLPMMNSSTISRAASSENCTGGDFMK